jgi:hypothetical protein
MSIRANMKTGKTSDGWNIYENSPSTNFVVTECGAVIYGCIGSWAQPGNTVMVRTQRGKALFSGIIKDVLPTTKEAYLAKYPGSTVSIKILK